jgi:hypothetical protein
MGARMKSATIFSSGFVTCLAAVSIACGGGGSGDGYTLAAGELAPWEWEAGVQAMREGADCPKTIYTGNKGVGPWPPVSWPSTPVLWRAK